MTLVAWNPPPEIAEFRLERLLGRGATAYVWLARHTLLDRVVALKIASTPASEETRTRFRVEARAVAKLQHPNLLAVHHVGEVDDRPFIVTDYLPGRSLDELERPVSPERVVAIGIDLARGLAAAHHAGVLHRDIKPANAFLDEAGVAKLLDFGLAKLADVHAVVSETPTPGRDPAPQIAQLMDGSPAAWSTPGAFDSTNLAATSSGNVVGTPLYMAPETWRGEPPTRRTDVYSLGALLFELLAGKPPCEGHSVTELHRKVLGGEIGDLAASAPSAPPELVRVVMRCLRLAPEERPTADELCDALARVLAPPRSALAEALDDPSENPYRGLLTFGPEHRALFHGREAETAAVLSDLRASPFVLVAGSSGAGKSSLVRAGVVPKVEKGALAAGTEWRSAIVVPGRRPIDALAHAVALLLGMGEEEVGAHLARLTSWLADEMRTARSRVLFVVDQLEEIWTLSTAAEREAFFAILAEVARSSPTVRIVATLRADFLGRVEDMGDLQPHALRAVTVLRPMTADGLRRAIAEPAIRRGVTIEGALVEHLVAYTEAGSLPLLEFALGALYARRDLQRDSIGLADLEALGGVEGALATHADAALARLPAVQRREARGLLLALVTVERTRSRREERDLVDRASPDRRGALEALVEARLVVASAGEHGAAYEVAHEALLSGWPTLRGWLDEEGAVREAAERVRRAAAEWERVGRTDEALFGERQLGELDVLERSALDDASARFLAASFALIRRARVRRWGVRVGLPIAGVLLAAAIGGGIRWSERRQAHVFVAARVAEADAPIRDARRLDVDVEAARADSFGRYDTGDAAGGESRWGDALAMARREADAFAAASAPLGLALARDPSDARARASAADLAYLWLLAAERDHQAAVARDLAARLSHLDDDGSRRARLAAPARLQVTTSPPGARVVLHAVHVDAEGRRVEDEGRAIDLAVPLELAPGSYVLAASAPGRYSTRLPLLLARAQDERVEIPLPPAAAVPTGFVFVPAGTSLFGAADVESVRTAIAAEPEHPRHVDAFLMAEHEVTFADYLPFLATLSAADVEKRRPSAGRFDLTYGRDGVPVLAIGDEKHRPGEPYCLPARSERRCQDWRRFPIVGIPWGAAQAYVAWLARGPVPGARLCSEREWERAARGADGRLFPGGDELHPGDANYDATYAGDAARMGLDEAGSFPNDRSPFGIFDLAGNVAEWVGLERPARTARGGFYYAGAPSARAAFRYVRAEGEAVFLGLRVCAAAPSP